MEKNKSKEYQLDSLFSYPQESENSVHEINIYIYPKGGLSDEKQRIIQRRKDLSDKFKNGVKIHLIINFPTYLMEVTDGSYPLSFEELKTLSLREKVDIVQMFFEIMKLSPRPLFGLNTNMIHRTADKKIKIANQVNIIQLGIGEKKISKELLSKLKNLEFLAPEVLKLEILEYSSDEEALRKADIFSLGMIVRYFFLDEEESLSLEDVIERYNKKDEYLTTIKKKIKTNKILNLLRDFFDATILFDPKTRKSLADVEIIFKKIYNDLVKVEESKNKTIAKNTIVDESQKKEKLAAENNSTDQEDDTTKKKKINKNTKDSEENWTKDSDSSKKGDKYDVSNGGLNKNIQDKKVSKHSDSTQDDDNDDESSSEKTKTKTKKKKNHETRTPTYT